MRTLQLQRGLLNVKTTVSTNDGYGKLLCDDFSGMPSVAAIRILSRSSRCSSLRRRVSPALTAVPIGASTGGKVEVLLKRGYKGSREAERVLVSDLLPRAQVEADGGVLDLV